MMFIHCECNCHTIHKITQWKHTSERLTLQESVCLCMCSNISSDWLPYNIKTMQIVLKIFKMAPYIQHRPHIYVAEREKYRWEQR